MINFDNIFKNTKTYKLEVNYRSNKSIVDMANKSINFNLNKVNKTMVSMNDSINKPRFVLADTDANQVAFVIKKVVELLEIKQIVYLMVI